MSDCIFCKIAAGEIPSMKIFEDDKTLAFMDVAKDVDGHILVVPKKHYTNIFDITPDTLNAVMHTVQLVSNHLKDDCGYEGINLFNNNAECAGQAVLHYHIHIIPRKTGDAIDANPKFDGAKVDLDTMHEQLKM